MQTTIAQRFRDALANFMRAPENRGTFSAKTRARAFMDAEPQLTRLFCLDQAERGFRLLERAEVRAAEETERRTDPQLQFAGPGFAELFRGLEQRLPIKEGRKIRLDLMSIAQMRESAEELRERAKKRAAKMAAADEKRAAWLDEMADQMAPHARARRNLKFGDYLALCADGVIRAGKAARA